MELKHDLQIDIATANSRKAKLWKNRTVPWSELAEKVLTTTRTPETLAEYRKMGKTQQAQIKDVGGFVGGYCSNGRRSDVRHRSVLTLDADEASPDLWDDYKMIVGCAAAVYSTHKHTADKPRLRLVLPLSRAVTPDEYQAIGRRVADDLGIDQFDDTTYQAARLMYWPSTSQDGVFFAEVFDAPALDPDKVLSRYKDWRDISSWPVSSRVAEIIKKEASKQADPTEKTGLVGAFCRAYSIEDAIETFVESYSPCGDGRYTYDLGSTAGGVTTYEGKFSYSFHATDPASGQLCNAWDLVRIHKFNELDADVDQDKQPGSRPSWKAMQDLAANDSRVKAQILSDRSSDFDEPVPEDDWISNLKITKDGAVASTIDNAVVILEHDPTLSGVLMYNGLTHTIGTSRALPWKDDPGGWSDADDSGLRYYLEKAYALSGKDKIFDAVNVVAMRHQIHPVREYLSGCGWDGVPRLDTLLIDYLGAEDNEYVRAVTRKTLVAAVARIFNPGVKFDYMLTLQGRQGIGKSALIAKLGGKWFSDTFSTLQGKDAYEQLHGVWIMEVGELAGMKKAEAETIKLFISKQVDRFRPAYGRRSQEFPRQCIFIGTTNESQFLRDMTGNRRFWIVDTPGTPKLSIWDDLTDEKVRQIWGEAVSIYREGKEQLFLSGQVEKVAQAMQARYEEENPKKGIIEAYLDRLLPEDWDGMDLYARREWLDDGKEGTVRRERVCSIEIWAEAFGGNPDKIDRYISKEINDILSSSPEWFRPDGSKMTTPYGRQRFFRRRG